MPFVISFVIVLVILVADYFWRKKKSFIGRFGNWVFIPTAMKFKTDDKSKGYDIAVNLDGIGQIRLSIDVDITKLSKIDRDFVGDLVDKMQGRQKTNGK
jgi:hypothetical protein